MKNRDTFIFYRSIYESAQVLDIEDRIKFYEAVMQYSMDFKEPELMGIPQALFILLKPTLSKSNTQYINGSKPKRSQSEAKEKPTANNKDKDKDKDIKKQVKKDFTFKLSKITQYENLSQEYKEQFVKYAIENIRDGGKLLSAMVDYHTSNGKGFKDWSAAFRTWVRNDKKFSRSSFKGKEPEVGSIAWRMQQQQNEIDVEVIE